MAGMTVTQKEYAKPSIVRGIKSRTEPLTASIPGRIGRGRREASRPEREAPAIPPIEEV